MTDETFKYIDIEKTMAEFGYDPRELSHGSAKKVFSSCYDCGIWRLQKFSVVGKAKRCSSCAKSGVNNPLFGTTKSEETRARLSASISGENHPMFGKTGKNNPLFGKKRSEETRAKMSASHLGKTISKEARTKMSASKIGEKHNRFGKTQSEETRAKISAAILGTKRSKETIAKLSGKNSCRYGKPTPNTTGAWYEKIDGTKIWMRSSWEIKFANWLDDNGKEWLYEPKVFELKIYDEELPRDGTYTPDFFVEGKWFEVKGRWTYDGFLKFCHFEHQYPKEQINLLRKADLLALGIKL